VAVSGEVVGVERVGLGAANAVPSFGLRALVVGT
jgi:hypothetical protein